VQLLAEAGGQWALILHDNDLVPIDASPAETDRIVREFKAACENQVKGAEAPSNLFYDPVFP